ncbi:hypothetical protein TWF225_004103 [Orbilia oligospora]|nr:hypothetical protein TWF225_004103 [Orbilia oligospora]KAF3248164.1 hypothetical protein TWF128_008510 [Orbilia oligospora]KAF3248165.1 hypothetical protein TWF128_008510 [Orbilia oligospora]KAF3257771.1 hypothetical protein TWF217_005880 [Orbilia oligospora]KAF3257772.1 hypothetical protein TWF217_005880 [Orbilia oligospora]
MQVPGFTHTPISQFFVYYLVIAAVLISVSDYKYLFHIQIIPHLWRWGQWWRVLIWQFSYANTGEVLFASLAVYTLRVVERLWGSRKFASFITYNLIFTSLITPFLLAIIFRPLTLWRMNYLPPGPTPLIFAILAQFHATIPSTYKFRLLLPISPSPPPPEATPSLQVAREESEPSITLSDKFYVYIVAAQLAVSQFPGSLVGAAVGWIAGYAWRAEVVPWGRWRWPIWLFEKRGVNDGGSGYGELRRMARGEGEQGTGVQQVGEGQEQGDGEGRRPLSTQILDQFRGGF